MKIELNKKELKLISSGLLFELEAREYLCGLSKQGKEIVKLLMKITDIRNEIAKAE